MCFVEHGGRRVNRLCIHNVQSQAVTIEEKDGARRREGEYRMGWDKLRLKRPMETVRLPEGRGLRLHCLSDLHTDYKANMEW